MWISSLCQAWGQLQEASCQPYLPISMATLSSTEPCPCIPPLAAEYDSMPQVCAELLEGQEGLGPEGAEEGGRASRQGPFWTPWTSSSARQGSGPSCLGEPALPVPR